MAEGKNIEIRIAATGGDQAAAELAKPKQGIDSLIVSEDGLAQKRAGFMTAAQAEIAEIERETAALDRAEKEMNKWKDAQAGASVAMAKTGVVLGGLADQKNKVTQSSTNMRFQMQNVGYQVQDLAVQIGSGTSAFRAMGQQLPQLASGFGPWGVALGTVAAIALPLAGTMFNLGEKTEEAGSKADDAAEKFKKLMDQRMARAAAAGLAENKAWIDSLDDERGAIKLANDELQRSIDLLQAKRRGQLEIENAQAAVDMANIDADPNLTDSQKITARAGIQNQLEKKKFDVRREDAIATADKGDREAGVKRAEAGSIEIEANQLFAKLQKQEEEIAALERKLKYGADQAAKALPELQKVEQELIGNYASAEGLSDKGAQEFETKIAAAKKAREEAQNAAGRGTNEDREALRTLQGEKDEKTGTFKGGEIEQTEKAWRAKQADVTKAAQEADDAEKKAAFNRALEIQKVEQDREATTRRLQATNITSGSASTKAQKADVEKEAKSYGKQFWDEQADMEKQLQGELERKKEKLKEDARANQLTIETNPLAKKGTVPTRNTPGIASSSKGLKKPKATNIPKGGDVSKDLQSLAKDIGGADNTADINAVKEAVKAKSGELGAAVVTLLTEMISKQEAQVNAVKDLANRLRRLEGK